MSGEPVTVLEKVGLGGRQLTRRGKDSATWPGHRQIWPLICSAWEPPAGEGIGVTWGKGGAWGGGGRWSKKEGCKPGRRQVG
jgi:hypothetical protein